jgi:hypothetical protein
VVLSIGAQLYKFIGTNTDRKPQSGEADDRDIAKEQGYPSASLLTSSMYRVKYRPTILYLDKGHYCAWL